MEIALVESVWQRARERCEYCLLPRALSLMPFEIDHIIPRKHSGTTESQNLALACFYCNRYKGPNIAGFDVGLSEPTRLFHPRKDDWAQHFQWKGTQLFGITAIGRVTIELLRMNHPEMIVVREALLDEGVFPF